MFTFFGQFFDHGLDLVDQGGGTVFVPLKDRRPVVLPAPARPIIERLLLTNLPGPTGSPVTARRHSADHAMHRVTSSGRMRRERRRRREVTTRPRPFVDQNQTYTSHPSHQVFRASTTVPGWRQRPTGRLAHRTAGGVEWQHRQLERGQGAGPRTSRHRSWPTPTSSMFRCWSPTQYGHFSPGPTGLPQMVTKCADGSKGLRTTSASKETRRRRSRRPMP